MNQQIYQKFLFQFVADAYKHSDGTTKGMIENLQAVQKPGRFTPNREEKTKAIDTARQFFEEHRHWPVEIVVSQLGLVFKDIRDQL